jgi:two-component system cell cycle response regulator
MPPRWWKPGGSVEPSDPGEQTDGATTTVVLGDERPASDEQDGGCLVQIYGDGLGRRVELHPGRTRFGREDDNDVVLAVESVSRRHCDLTVARGLVAVCDLGSTNGTFVADQRLEPNETVELRSGDLVQIGSEIFKFLQGGNIEALYYDELYRSSVIDGLTRLYNRRYLFDHVAREIARAHRHGRALSLILFDVDHFKRINDQHGHLAGDAVLRELAELVSRNVRREDCCARYGGEEFAIASTENDVHSSYLLAEKLRGLVETHDFSFEGQRIPLTISAGVAMLTPDMAEPVDLVGAADARLYEAKRDGRNCVAR